MDDLSINILTIWLSHIIGYFQGKLTSNQEEKANEDPFDIPHPISCMKLAKTISKTLMVLTGSKNIITFILNFFTDIKKKLKAT